MESEIEEHSSSDEGSKMNWILDNGLMLGKKALLTSLVISSAPFVLPPLAVLSALGLAFSVPSGLAVASYACTEKLMSKLLPLPSHLQPSVEYLEEEDDSCNGGKIDMGKDEEITEDTKRGVEVRYELVDEGNEVWIEGKLLVEQDDLGPECIINDEAAEPAIQLGTGQLVGETSYENDVEDDPPKEEEQTLEATGVGVEESRDGKVHRLVVVFEKNDSHVEEIKDEHPVNEIRRVVVKVGQMDESVEVEKPIQVITTLDLIDEEKLAVETLGSLERTRDEEKSMEEAEQREKGISGEDLEEMAIDNIVRAEELMSVMVETADVKSAMEEDPGLIEYERTTMMLKIGEMEVDNNVSEDILLHSNVISGADVRETVNERDIPMVLKENMISNADVRELVVESGFDLLDDNNAADEQYAHVVSNISVGKIPKTDISYYYCSLNDLLCHIC